MDRKSRFDNRPPKNDGGERRGHGWLTTDQVVSTLGVKAATVYTYVSRGWLAAVANPHGRGSLYSEADVAKLKLRARARSGHGPVASAAMRWGDPIIETSISTVRDGVLIYRGQTLGSLLRDAPSFESVCDLLWATEGTAGWRIPRTEVSPGVPNAGVSAAGEDLGADFIGPWIATLAGIATTTGAGAYSGSREGAVAQSRHVVETLVAGIPNHPLVDGALICCADHELNASAFAARVASSTGADLYHCLIAALATFSGPKHGSASLRVEALVAEALQLGCGRTTVAARLQRGESLPGLGHPLYPDGDPRAQWLIERASEAAGADSRSDPPWHRLREMLDAFTEFGCPAPNLDTGLVALTIALRLPAQTGRHLFAAGRLAGWCAHIMEQRESPDLLRPRARYVGG